MRILFIGLLASSISFSQILPSWFLSRPDTNYSYYYGFVETGDYYSETSYKAAFEKACLNAAQSVKSTYFIDQTFISAGGEKSWANYKADIVYDTSLTEYFLNSLSIIDSFQTEEHTIVIASNTSKKLTHSNIGITQLAKPKWIETPPHSDNYYYADGATEEYYHIESSWDEAESIARLELARQKNLKMKQIQKVTDSSYYDITNEVTNATLRSVQSIARWFDPKEKVYHVLLQMPK